MTLGEAKMMNKRTVTALKPIKLPHGKQLAIEMLETLHSIDQRSYSHIITSLIGQLQRD